MANVPLIGQAAAPVRPGESVFTDTRYKPGLLFHIVLLRFRRSVSTADKAAVFRWFLALQHSTRRDGRPYILLINGGAPNLSLEGAGMRFEQAYVVAFNLEGDRNYYVGRSIVKDPGYFDPRHEDFKVLAGPLLAKPGGALVFDYAVSAG